jgi:uncharacterized protein (TIRG00374 family)
MSSQDTVVGVPDPQPRGRVWLATAVAFSVAIVVVLVAFADGQKLLDTASAISPVRLAVPVLAAALSYAAMARSYQLISAAAGYPFAFRDMLRITLVANSANYVVSSGGLSGFAVRMFLLTQRGVPSSPAVLISLVQTFLTNFVLLFFVLAGFAHLVFHRGLTGWALGSAVTALALFVGVIALGVACIFQRRLRRRTLLFCAEAGHRLLRRLAPPWKPRRVALWRFQHNLNLGLEFLLARKRSMVAPALYIAVDWAFTMAVLYGAFATVHYPVGLGVVVVGFAVGILLSLVSLIPGGLGVMEASLTAIFAGLGVPFEVAVIVAIVFRLAYYILPLLVSVFFFHGMMTQATHPTSARTQPVRPERPRRQLAS